MSDFFYNKYPYTDFHELNLDWVLTKVKEVVAEWAETLTEWHNTQEEWTTLYNYVHDYFDNLDVQQEINNKLDAMMLDGSMATLAQPFIDAKVAELMPATVSAQIGNVVADQISGTVASQINAVVANQISAPAAAAAAAWLADHITQPTTPAIDTSLTVPGAAADAAITGLLATSAYDPTSTYDIGDYVNYNGSIYQCLYHITSPEAWTASHWINTDICSELKTAADKIYYLDTDMINGFSSYVSGYLMPGGGGIGANIQYITSDPMPVRKGETILYQGKNTAGGITLAYGYTDTNFGNPVALTTLGVYDGLKVLVIPDNVNYVRATAISSDYTGTTPLLLKANKNTLFYDAGMGSIRTFFSTYVVNPSEYNRYKIYVMPGTYSFDNEFTAAELSDPSFIGVVVPVWTSLIGWFHESVNFRCTISSTSISTLNLSSGTCLENINVYGENCRYAIHDDFGINNDRSVRIFRNCNIVANTCSYGYAYGGGCRSGQSYLYERCKFIANDYDGGGYLMHSNTNYTRPVIMTFNDCIFDSQNGHPERAINIRGLGNTSVVNQAFFNNCTMNGMYLQRQTIFDWYIGGSGNTASLYQRTSSDCTVNFADIPLEVNLLTPTAYTALPAGMQGWRNGKPCWWSGTAWVDASGNNVT